MLDNECLFCKIIKGEIQATKIYEDEYVLCFKDISPVTPVHVLVVPKIHIKNVNEINLFGNVSPSLGHATVKPELKIKKKAE